MKFENQSRAIGIHVVAWCCVSHLPFSSGSSTVSSSSSMSYGRGRGCSRGRSCSSAAAEGRAYGRCEGLLQASNAHAFQRIRSYIIAMPCGEESARLWERGRRTRAYYLSNALRYNGKADIGHCIGNRLLQRHLYIRVT
eukprot:1690515-Prymnesium_polylepis.1